MLAFPQNTSKIESPNAFTSNPDYSNVVTIGNLRNGNVDNFVLLINNLSGKNITKEDILSTDVNAFLNDIFPENLASCDFYIRKQENKDIMLDLVGIGDYNFTPTMLSKDKSGDYILTLWFTNNEQFVTYNQNGLLWVAGTGNEGGINGIFSPYAVYLEEEGLTNICGSDCDFPSNMYSTSYIHMMLGNVFGEGGIEESLASEKIEGAYVLVPTSGTGNKDELSLLESYEDVWYLYLEMIVLCYQYMVTPAQVDWQATQSSGVVAKPNEYWNIPYDTKNDEGHPDRADFTYLWKNDLFWLPSVNELDMWGVSEAQKKNGTGNDEDSECGTWLRSGDGTGTKAYVLNASGTSVEERSVSEYHAVRPAFHLNLTKLMKQIPRSLDKVSSDPNDPDIYQEPGANEGEINFHIKSADGFKMLSSSSAGGFSFDPKWTFYLENDIEIHGDDFTNNYHSIGDDANPFVSTFDGKGLDGNIHKITFVWDSSADTEILNKAVFGVVGDCSIRNLIMNLYVSISSGYTKNCGVVENVLTGATCNISHVVMQVDKMFYHRWSEIEPDLKYLGNLNLYDTNIEFYSSDGYNENNDQCLFFGLSNINIDSCRIHIYNDGNTATAIAESSDVVIKNTYVSMGSNSDIFKLCKNLIIIECQFEIGGGNQSCLLSDGNTNLRIYDTLINCENLSTLFADGNYPTGEGAAYYYSGVYIHDPKFNTTTILDPSFTSYKWCADPHLNNGLPQLRRFVSISDFMEQCDMTTWSNEILKQQNAA